MNSLLFDDVLHFPVDCACVTDAICIYSLTCASTISKNCLHWSCIYVCFQICTKSSMSADDETKSRTRTCRHGSLPSADYYLLHLSCFLLPVTFLLVSLLPTSLCAVTLQENEFQMSHVYATRNGWVPDEPLTCPSGANWGCSRLHAHPVSPYASCMYDECQPHITFIIAGHTISEIISAAYGSDQYSNCRMVEVSAVLESQCLGLETCLPDFSVGLGYDPCGDSYKWIDAIWNCSPSPHPTPDNLSPIKDGLVGLYIADSWNGMQWSDRSGSGNHVTRFGGTINKSPTSMNGNSYLYGDTGAWLIWPLAILPPVYTLFHVAKYNNGATGRIFAGNSGFNGFGNNWFSGFHGGRTGVAYHDGMLTAYNDLYGNNWIISTDQNGLYRWVLVIKYKMLLWWLPHSHSKSRCWLRTSLQGLA